jgi:hypothetical protein
MSSLQKYFLSPHVPNTAAGFVDDNFAVIELRRGRGGFAPASSAITQLEPELIYPSFDTPNIQKEEELAEIIVQTVEAAGLDKKKRWSVALPDATSRTLVLTLESKPSSRRELNEVIAWKVERFVPSPSSELRISKQRISPVAGQDRYLVTVAHDEVISQYESLFFSIGWEAGMILPRHIGEAQWLIWDSSPGDKLLVSANRSGFTSVIVRNGEPVLIRNHQCEPAAMTDELHRFALYYRDRLAGGAASALTRMLVLGDIDAIEAREAIYEATDTAPHVIEPAEMGFNLKGEAIRFDHIAGPAGLATIAWQ